MAVPLTIQGELRLPGTFLQGRDMDVIEGQLYAYGLLPVQAEQRRWRMDPDVPGGYIMTYVCVLPAEV